MNLKNYSRHVEDMRHAVEQGTLRITTEEAGAVIARYVENERVIIYYNLHAQTCHVMVYKAPGSLDLLCNYETNQPLVLAGALAFTHGTKICEEYHPS